MAIPIKPTSKTSTTSSTNKKVSTFDDLLVFGNVKVLDSITVKKKIIGSFEGNLTGTADAALKASRDILGQDIESTYIKNIETFGTTVTITKGNGDRVTIHTQDTTYDTGTETVSGITKLYHEMGNNTDGSMTQQALTEEFDTKLDVKDKFMVEYNEDNKRLKFSYAGDEGQEGNTNSPSDEDTGEVDEDL